jgi:hypothetical protein
MPKPETLKMRLVVDVEYKPNGRTMEDLKEYLMDIPYHAAGDGLFTGHGAAEVERLDYHVEDPSPKEVSVLLYTHRHGTDFSVYATDALAHEAAANLVMENLGDLDSWQSEEASYEIAKDIRSKFNAKDYCAVMGAWEEAAAGEESFEIDQRMVHVEGTK